MKDIFLVDADDTVLNFHGAAEHAIEAAFIQNGEPWKAEYMAEYRKLNAGLWEALERKEITREWLMEQRFPIFLKHLGIGLDGAAFNRVYIEHLSTHPLYLDGAQDFLNELGKRGRVFIVTNGTESIQKRRFDISDLWSYAEDVFISQTTGYDKPAKGYTDYVAAHIKDFDYGRAVWIGDSLSADIKAANEAGITSIWFNPHGKKGTDVATPDYTAKSFDEILEILRRIYEGNDKKIP
ncbi:MAG: YjjG family noncanonical pyrimidine nucleotidase [Clostridia bacterium]|nr:YjjG family noncanonical pyrimidine nucleotidase [Clostridia bacterium]